MAGTCLGDDALASGSVFLMITKRITRLQQCLPPDWGEGYPNVHICCTVENQRQAQIRLPVYQKAPIRHKSIICSPLLGPIDLSPYLGDWVEEVVAAGESGEEARPCHYDWVLDLRRQCVENQVPFHFMQTGARLVKDGKCYRIARRYQHSQAKAAGIDFTPPGKTENFLIYKQNQNKKGTHLRSFFFCISEWFQLLLI